MRIDKFLKLSRIIKRRTLANEACAAGRVKINGRVAKPSSEVGIGDIIEVGFGNRMTKLEVLNISEHVSKAGAADLYRLIQGDG